MRGTKAKAIRRAAVFAAPPDIDRLTSYMVKVTMKKGREIQADGTTKEVPVPRRTFLLNPTCLRYWHQRAKQHLARASMKGIPA